MNTAMGVSFMILLSQSSVLMVIVLDSDGIATAYGK